MHVALTLATLFLYSMHDNKLSILLRQVCLMEIWKSNMPPLQMLTNIFCSHTLDAPLQHSNSYQSNQQINTVAPIFLIFSSVFLADNYTSISQHKVTGNADYFMLKHA